MIFSDGRSKSFLAIRFNDYFDASNLTKSILLLPYFGHPPNVADAFKTAQMEAFTNFNGNTNFLKKLMVKNKAELLRLAKITRYSIGENIHNTTFQNINQEY